MVEKKRIVGDGLMYTLGTLASGMELWGDMSTRYVVRVRYVGMNGWMDATKMYKSENMNVSRGSL